MFLLSSIYPTNEAAGFGSSCLMLKLPTDSLPQTVGQRYSIFNRSTAVKWVPEWLYIKPKSKGYRAMVLRLKVRGNGTVFPLSLSFLRAQTLTRQESAIIVTSNEMNGSRILTFSMQPIKEPPYTSHFTNYNYNYTIQSGPHIEVPHE